MHREAVLFFVLNVVGLLIAEAVIGLVTYVMGLRGPLEYNAASFVGTGLGTIFRFYAYRKWVFLAPGGRRPARRRCPTPQRSPTTRRGSSTRRSSRRPRRPPQAPRRRRPSYSSPWERQPRSSPGPGGSQPSPWGAQAALLRLGVPGAPAPSPRRSPLRLLPAPVRTRQPARQRAARPPPRPRPAPRPPPQAAATARADAAQARDLRAGRSAGC